MNNQKINEDSIFRNMGASLEEMEIAIESFEKVLSFKEILDTVSSKKSISTETMNDLKIGFASLMSEIKAPVVVFSLEDLENNTGIVTKMQVSLEATTISFTNVIHNTLQVYKNNFLYSIDFFNSLKKDLMALKNRAKELSSDLKNNKVDIDLPMNRFLVYGDKKEISDLKEYLKELEITFKALNGVMTALDTFRKDNRFGGLKTFLSFIPFGVDVHGWFRKNFDFFIDFIKNIKKGIDIKSHEDKHGSSTFFSPVYLGNCLFRLITSNSVIDNPDSINKSNLAYMLAKLSFVTVTLTVDRYGENVVFRNMTIKDINSIISITEKAIDAYTEYNSNVTRFITWFDSVMALATMPSPLGGIILYMASYRMRALYTVMLIVNMNVGNVYYFGKGNIKQAMKIANKALDKLEK